LPLAHAEHIKITGNFQLPNLAFFISESLDVDLGDLTGFHLIGAGKARVLAS
jgi:hypothetical protein